MVTIIVPEWFAWIIIVMLVVSCILNALLARLLHLRHKIKKQELQVWKELRGNIGVEWWQ
jgi:hypothetical protein